jgi:hypothetical protein
VSADERDRSRDQPEDRMEVEAQCCRHAGDVLKNDEGDADADQEDGQLGAALRE